VRRQPSSWWSTVHHLGEAGGAGASQHASSNLAWAPNHDFKSGNGPRRSEAPALCLPAGRAFGTLTQHGPNTGADPTGEGHAARRPQREVDPSRWEADARVRHPTTGKLRHLQARRVAREQQALREVHRPNRPDPRGSGVRALHEGPGELRPPDEERNASVSKSLGIRSRHRSPSSRRPT